MLQEENGMVEKTRIHDPAWPGNIYDIDKKYHIIISNTPISHIDHLVTIQSSAGKPWVQILCHTTHPNTTADKYIHQLWFWFSWWQCPHSRTRHPATPHELLRNMTKSFKCQSDLQVSQIPIQSRICGMRWNTSDPQRTHLTTFSTQYNYYQQPCARRDRASMDWIIILIFRGCWSWRCSTGITSGSWFQLNEMVDPSSYKEFPLQCFLA